MSRTGRALVLAVAAMAGGVVVARHARGMLGRESPGGILVPGATAYDVMSRWLLAGSLYAPVAADVAAAVPPGSRVLDVGCGSGRLSVLLAQRDDLDVAGVDLDPAMVGLANAARRGRVAGRAAGGAAEGASGPGVGRSPVFLVGDVAALPFPDQSFDLVVSTLSMHHWADPAAGLVEIGRVLRPGAKAIIWDFRAGRIPMHGHLAGPADHVGGSPLRVVSATAWPWPGRIRLMQRVELAHDA